MRAANGSAPSLNEFLKLSADYLGLNRRTVSCSLWREPLRLAVADRRTLPVRDSRGNYR